MVWLEVPMDEYTSVREHPLRFVVAPTHEIPDIERIVERGAGYFVIEKPDEVAHIIAPGP